MCLSRIQGSESGYQITGSTEVGSGTTFGRTSRKAVRSEFPDSEFLFLVQAIWTE
jgi:hypothetical protein